VDVSSACIATAGTWLSPYDGATWTKPADVDIDHMVPLKNAWVVGLALSSRFRLNLTTISQSGAASWTTSKRKQFANDVVRPQLWAVTDKVNEAKGDKSPDQWQPPLMSFNCAYAKSWIEVKSYWALSITSAEKAALSSMLGQCSQGGQVLPLPQSGAITPLRLGYIVRCLTVSACLIVWL
jgi:hypothetical protein